jgi:Kdo2-lipid IVA lauroyltransferase/acyltransferase
MKTIYFWLYYPILKILSLLPMKILYLFSDFLYLIVYQLFKYRKKVTYYNLKRSFPTASEQEIFRIQKAFYHHLCDLIVENVKMFSISKQELSQRMDFPVDFIEKDFGTNRSIILLLGHVGNWEWAGMASSFKASFKTHIVYHSLSNENFDLLMQKTRSKFGAILSPMQETLKTILKNKQEAVATCLVADQNPVAETAYWGDFLNRKTAFFRGPAKIAQKLDLPIYYVQVKKIKRGYYKLNPSLLIESPKQHTEEQILDKYIQKLETDIIENPAHWLWSHRRWKHKYEQFNN